MDGIVCFAIEMSMPSLPCLLWSIDAVVEVVVHVNITASFLKLDIRPTLSEKVFSQLLLKNGMIDR